MTAQIVWLAPEYVPNDDASPSGGSCSSNIIHGQAVSELMPRGVYPLAGASDVVWYYSLFAKNIGNSPFYGQGSDAGPRLWTPAGVRPVTTPGAVTATSDNAADIQTMTVHGFVSAGNPPESVTLVGTNTATGSLRWTGIWKIELSAPAAGNITVSVGGTSICVIPGGTDGLTWDFATAEYSLGIVGALNTSIQATNRLTPYAGLTYTLPTSFAGGLVLPGPLNAGDAVQLCLKWTGKAGLDATPRSRFTPILRGVT